MKSRLTYAILIVMASTMLSRIVGFVREMLLPNMLSVGVQTDAYNNAFILPDLMYSLLLGGAISAALIPVLTGFIDTGNEKDGWQTISTFINTIFILMIVLCIAGVIFSNELMTLLISGDDKQETRDLAAGISRILFPSIAFLMLSGILNGVLNSYKKFAAAALGPIVYNIGSALSIYFLSPYGVEKIAYGVLASAVVYFLIVFAFSLRDLKYYKPVLRMRTENSKKLFALALPSFLSASVVQVNIMVSMKFANYFEEGRVTAFRLADRTWQMPYGIIAVSMGIAVLPTLSGVFANRDIQRFTQLITKSIKYLVTMILPCSVAFLIMNHRIVTALFRFSTNLNQSDVKVISNILFIFSAALMTQSLVAILNRAFYSMQETKIPLYTGAFTILLNIGLSYMFYKTTKLDINGIAIAYAASSFLNMILLTAVLKSRVKSISVSDLLKYTIRLLPPLCGMAGAILILDRMLPERINDVSLISKLSQAGSLLFISFAAALVYFFLIIFFKVPEGIDVFNKICRKLKIVKLVINTK